ncbi:MAG: hypothetical protein AAFR73_06340 [Pseudomonadota bacterium]
MSTIPILLPESCLMETSSIADVSWFFGVFISDLEKRGAVWSSLPNELKEVSAINTYCAGHRSNGSRTSLRNLVMLEGLDFTRAFLRAAEQGAQRLGWSMRRRAFEAEMAWLDEVGPDAPKVLDDYNVKTPALKDADDMFFKALLLDETERAKLLAPLSSSQQERYERAEQNHNGKADGHYSRIFVYVVNHASLSVVPMSEGPNRMMNWYSAVDECAKLIKADL